MAVEQRASRPVLILLVLCTAEFMTIIDFSIVTVALDAIRTDLAFGDLELQWVINGYGVAIAACLLLGGRIGDLYGMRRTFFGGMALFTVASLMGGFAESPGALIAARAAQGLGAALVAPTALALLMLNVDERRRARALGVWAAIGASGVAAGLLMGGLITEYLSWRWVLWVNVPVGCAVLLAVPRVLSETCGPRRSVDLAGAVLVATGLLSVVYALSRTGDSDGITATAWALAGTALLALFVIVERRAAAPLLPPAFLRRRVVAGANIICVLANAALIGSFVLLALHFSSVLGFSAVTTGVAMIPVAVSMVVGSAVCAPVLVDRWGERVAVGVGMVTCAGGLAWIGVDLPGADAAWVPVVVSTSVLIGLGYGVACPAWTAAGVRGVASHDQGLATGVMTTAQEVGAAAGLAVLSTVAAAHGTATAIGGAAVVALAAALGAVTLTDDEEHRART